MSELTFRVYTEIITLELVFLSLFLNFLLFGFDAYVSSLLVRMFLHIASHLQLKVKTVNDEFLHVESTACTKFAHVT